MNTFLHQLKRLAVPVAIVIAAFCGVPAVAAFAADDVTAEAVVTEAETVDTAADDAEAADESTDEAVDATATDNADDASSDDDADDADDATATQSIEETASSWRYSNGQTIENPSTDSTTQLSLMATTSYSTWIKSYGSSYLGIVSSSTTTKVAVSGATRVIIDVSKWQGTIDWKKVAAAGVTAAIIRCGYGSDYESQDDACFIENVQGAQKYGIEIGIYLYSYATKATGSAPSAESEAAHVLRLLEEAGLEPSDLDLPVFLDMEDSTQASLSASTLGDIAETFCDIIEAEGYSVGIYASKSWWSSYLTDSAFDTESWYKWIACYPVSTSGAKTAVSSATTTDTTSAWYGTDIWQFTSHGTVSGISGNVDVSFDYVGSGGYYAWPSKPTISSATANSTLTSITLKWAKSTNATGYEIERLASDGTWETVATITSASTLTWTDSGLTAGTTYTYRMRAYGTSSSGSVVYGSYSAQTECATLPSTPSISVSVASSLTSATVSWAAISGVTGYEVWRCTSGTSYVKVATVTGSSTTSWTDSSRTLGTKYAYKVRAYQTVTLSTTESDGTVTTSTQTVYGSYSSAVSAYALPSTVTISSVACTSKGYNKVTWKKVSNATGYVIYRSVSGGSYKKVKTISSNSTVSWTDSSVTVGKTYRYKIRAYKKSGSTTVYSTSYSAVKKYVARPAAPSITGSSSTKKRTATLKWKKVSGATGYQVAYRIKGTSKWYYATVTTNSKKFTYMRNKNYYVKVRAYKKVSGTKYYGSWSSQKLMTVKQ